MNEIKELILELIPEATNIVETETGSYQFQDNKFTVELIFNCLGSRVVAWDLSKSMESIFISVWDEGEVEPELKNLFGKGKRHSFVMSKQTALTKWNKFKARLN